MGPFPNLNVLPKSQRPKSSLDITDPTSICEGLTDRASFPKAFRNEKVEIRSQLGDSLAVHPPVLPELGGGTIANYHLGRGKKDVMLHVRELEIQSPPGPKGISSHTPNPANTQTDSQPGEVRDTQPTVEQRTATLSPVDMAVPGPLYVYLPF